MGSCGRRGRRKDRGRDREGGERGREEGREGGGWREREREVNNILEVSTSLNACVGVNYLP